MTPLSIAIKSMSHSKRKIKAEIVSLNRNDFRKCFFFCIFCHFIFFYPFFHRISFEFPFFSKSNCPTPCPVAPCRSTANTLQIVIRSHWLNDLKYTWLFSKKKFLLPIANKKIFSRNILLLFVYFFLTGRWGIKRLIYSS